MDENINHWCRISEIKIKTQLSPIEAFNIARNYQKLYNLPGKISSDIAHMVFLNEKEYSTLEPAWNIVLELPKDEFEGSDDITIVVSDIQREVLYVLDHNGIPNDNHLRDDSDFTEEEIREILDL